MDSVPRDEKKEAKKKATGVYYRKMMEHVKKVLTDPGKVCPVYNKTDGYEIAGFVWFQGFNDMVDRWTYPNRTKPGGYDLYTKLLCHFIRDVRKDLNAPKMPFVIGVMGVDGIPTKYQYGVACDQGINSNDNKRYAIAIESPAGLQWVLAAVLHKNEVSSHEAELIWRLTAISQAMSRYLLDHDQ